MSSGGRTPAVDRAVRVASLNLYHWATPEIGWYGAESRHSEAGWAAKRRWLEETLRALDAGVVGFQEVVSVEALREVAAAAGYPHVATVAEPHFSADNPTVYNRPVQAVAARREIKAVRATPPEGVAGALGLSHDRDFRRAPIEAEIDVAGFGPCLFLIAHLKSPGVGVGDALIAGRSQPPEAPDAAARWTLEALSRAHAAAAVQRVFEASALYHIAAARAHAAPTRPILVMGDLNDEPDSAALSALTAYRPFERDGGAAEPEEADGATDAAARYRLVDAQRLAPRTLFSDARRPTHRSGAAGSAIDFILVSAALQPWSGDAVGMVLDFGVYAPWFRAASPAESSDHAAVVAALAPFDGL